MFVVCCLWFVVLLMQHVYISRTARISGNHKQQTSNHKPQTPNYFTGFASTTSTSNTRTLFGGILAALGRIE